MSPITVGWLGLVLPAAGALVAAGIPPAGLRALAATVGTLLMGVAVFVLVRGPGGGLDALSAWFLVPTCALGGLGLWQSLTYLSLAPEGTERALPERWFHLLPERRYVMLYLLFIACIAAVVLAQNLLVMWAAVEATTLASVLLVAHEATGEAIEAAWKYVAVTAAGGLVALFGTLAVLAAGSGGGAIAGRVPEWLVMTGSARHLALVGVAFAVVGYGTKAGLSPLHTWLPDAHAEAPAPVSGLLSGIELSTALLALVRVLRAAVPKTGSYWPTHLLFGLGILSVLTAAAFAGAQRDMKRLFAYSTVEHMGLVSLGLGIGGWAAWGALLHVWTHAAAKSLAFFGSGNVKGHYGTSRMRSLARLGHTLPWTTGALSVAAWALVGLPPFGPFVSEWLILTGAVQRGALDVAGAVVAAAALAAVLVGFGGRFAGTLFGSSETTELLGPAEPFREVWVLGVLAVCSIMAGFAGLVVLHTWLGTAPIL